MKLSLLIFAILSISVAGWAQSNGNDWKPLGPFSIHRQTGEVSAPGLGVFRTIDIAPDNDSCLLMGGMSSGIWLSKDKGRSWLNSSASLPVENVKKLQFSTANPSIAYAATTTGIIRSVDRGENWSFTSLNILYKLPCADRQKLDDDRTLLSLSPADAQTLIASVADTLFRTSDGGETWSAIQPGFMTQFIEWHPVNKKIVYAGGAFKKSPHSFVILRSLDGGLHFEPVNAGLPDPAKLVRLTDITATVSKADPDKLYLLIFGEAKFIPQGRTEEKRQMVGAFLVSSDAGKSFRPVPQKNNYRYLDKHYSVFHMYSDDADKDKYDFDYADKSFWQASFQQVGWATALASSDRDPQLLVMAASGAVFSKDKGTSWDFLRLRGSYAIHGDIQAAKIRGNDVWLVNDGGLNYINLLDRRQQRMEGYSGQDLWGFSTSFKSGVMAIGVDHSGTMIYDEKIYGKHWYHYGGGDAMTASINPFDDRYLYATPYDHYIIKRPSFLRDEASAVKSKISFGYIPNRNVEFHPNEVYRFFAIDEDKPHWRYDTCRVVATRDNGKTIDTLLAFPKKAYGKRVRISVSNPNTLYAICNKPSRCYATEDGGTTWNDVTPKDTIATRYGFNDIAIDDRNPKHVFLIVAGFQNKRKVLESVNGGVDWVDFHSGELPENELLTAAYQRGTDNGIYLGANPGVFYRSDKTGVWRQFGDKLPSSSVNFISLNYDQSKIRIGTYRGIWENDLAEDFKPRACFAINKTNLPQGESDERKVYFYDHSAIKRKGAQWYWEFPGSVQEYSTDENPIIDYETAKPGAYSVRLTITDSQGRKDSFEMKDVIKVRYNYPWNLRERKLEMEREAAEADEKEEEE